MPTEGTDNANVAFCKSERHAAYIAGNPLFAPYILNKVKWIN